MTATSTAQRATRALVVQLVDEVRRKLADQGRLGEFRPLVVGVRAAPIWDGGDVSAADGSAIVVEKCATPLRVREALEGAAGFDPADHTVVVLTDCQEGDLGTDVLSRFVRPRLLGLDPWHAVLARFNARQLDPEFGDESLRWSADALLRLRADRRNAPIAMLSVDTALAWLSRDLLGVDTRDTPTVQQLLRATTRPEFAQHVIAAHPDDLAGLCDVLAARLGPAGAPVAGAIRAGNGPDVLAGGLVARALEGADVDHVSVHFASAFCGDTEVDAAAARAWADAAEAVFDELRATDKNSAAGVVVRARELTTAWKAPNPGASAIVPAGFDARCDALGDAITAAIDGTGAFDPAPLRAALAAVEGHWEATDGSSRHRATRARLAAQLAVWLRTRDEPADTAVRFDTAVTQYVADGAWVDAARRRVDEGDATPAGYAAVLRTISEKVRAAREGDSRRFAHALAEWTARSQTTVLDDGRVRVVEDVLGDVVAPLAAAHKVCFVVLDGCGIANFLEFVGQFPGLGLSEVGRDGRRSVALAALPTVTEVSRASLLCGELTVGDNKREKAGFRAHANVRSLGDGEAVLFHDHTDIRSGAGVGQSLPDDVVHALSSRGPKLVGVVVNSIDDELQKGTYTPEYRITDMGPLEGILRLAVDAGRIVVVSADHGHVLGVGLDGGGTGRINRQMEGGGERWRVAGDDVADDEVVLRGPRVCKGGDAGVLAPWKDDIRYAARHGGYHGGATPDEVIVPLSVFVPTTADMPAGYAPVVVVAPDWWDLAVVGAPAPAVAAPAPSGRAKSKAVPENQGQLFAEPVPATAQAAGAASEPWIDALFASELWTQQSKAGRNRLVTVERARSTLHALVARGGVASFGVVAQATGHPVSRVGGFAASLARILNIDGYGVLTVDATAQEVRLDSALLRSQFQLGEE